MLANILGMIGQWCINIILYLGYPGIVFLMALESMIFPLPSELIMPFAGFLISQGKMSFWWVILASSVGSLLGSLLSYYLGKYGGRRTVLKFGKYLFLDETDLAKTEVWFQKRGNKTIFWSRFIPVVRHLISIPAGMGHMKLSPFLLYTFIGATIWNTFLAYLGYVLGNHWNLIRKYSEPVSILVAISIVVAGGYFIYRHVKHKKCILP